MNILEAYCTGYQGEQTACINRAVNATTNEGRFCLLGYTQNPKTEESTKHAMENGAKLCARNPWRFKNLSD